MYSCRSFKWTVINFGWWHWNVALGVPEPDISVFLLNSFFLDPCLWLNFRCCSLLEFSFLNMGLQKGHVSSWPICYIKNSLTYLLLFTQLRKKNQVWRLEVYCLGVFSGLKMIACMFLCVVALILTIWMVKGGSKVSVNNCVNHGGITCCQHVNVGCFKCFKDLFHCYFKINV